MANILTAAEAAAVLRTEITDVVMTALLPQVDAYIASATGRNWANDDVIHESAKSAARMLLVLWHEDPGVLSGAGSATMSHGLTAALTQLEAEGRRYHRFAGLNGSGSIPISDAAVGDGVLWVRGLRGVSGDQSAKFETAISANGYLQQVSGDDLSANWYEAYIVPVGGL